VKELLTEKPKGADADVFDEDDPLLFNQNDQEESHSDD
jgi:hypothetical protein